MTTTKELRAALRDVEPAFAGVDVGALRRRARRIRQLRILVGAVAGLSMAASVPVALPHMPIGPSADDSAGTGLVPMAGAGTPAASAGATPAAASVPPPLVPRTGALPVVGEPGRAIPVGDGPYGAWIFNAHEEGVVGRVCYYRLPVAASSSCLPLRTRQVNGAVADTVVRSPDGRATMLMVVESPVSRVTARSGPSKVPATIADLGQGYSMVAATMPARAPASASASEAARDAAVDDEVLAFDDRHRLIALHRSSPLIESEQTLSPGSPAARKPVRDVGPAAVVGPAGERLWMVPPSEPGSSPQVCTNIVPGAELDCSELTGGPTSALFTTGFTDDAGKSVVVVVTDSPVAEARAGLSNAPVFGTPVPVRQVDLGQGYTALVGTFPVSVGAQQLGFLGGFDDTGRVVASAVVGVQLAG